MLAWIISLLAALAFGRKSLQLCTFLHSCCLAVLLLNSKEIGRRYVLCLAFRRRKATAVGGWCHVLETPKGAAKRADLFIATRSSNFLNALSLI